MRWWLFLLLLPAVHAAGIDQALTSVDMDTDSVAVTSQYEIVSQAVEDLIIDIPDDVIRVTAHMDETERSCKIRNGTALCGSTKPGTHVFTIAYTSRNVLGTLDTRHVFKYTETLPFEAKEHTFALKLPVGSIIPKEEGKDTDFFITPQPDEVLSDGQRIIITWTQNDLSAVSVSAVTERVQNNTLWVVAIIAVAAAAGAGTAWYVLRKRKAKTPRKKKKKKAPVPQFMDDEQKIVNALNKAANKELWQNQLVKETGFSKAKLSRVLRNLEQRSVVSKTIYGNTNKIALKSK